MSTSLAFALVTGYDANGVYGSILHYAMVIALSGAAFLAFVYFWWKGRLDMDEEPKIQMMQEEEIGNGRT